MEREGERRGEGKERVREREMEIRGGKERGIEGEGNSNL